jgi:hypothetical protein
MGAVLDVLVFTGAASAAIGIILATVVPQHRRIVDLLAMRGL